MPAWALASLGDRHGDGNVPVVRRGNADRVDVVAIEQVAKVVVDPAIAVAVVLVGKRLGGFSRSDLDIAYGHVLRVGRAENGLQIVCAEPTHADVADHDPLASGRSPFAAQSGGRNHVRRRHDSSAEEGGALDKAPSTRCHFAFPSHSTGYPRAFKFALTCG